MRAIILILIASWLAPLSYSEDVVDLETYVFGVSHHFNRCIHWNEINPGVAVGIADHMNDNFDFILTAGGYDDSYSEAARFLLAGIRGIAGERNAFHITLSISTGYFEGSDNQGTPIIPVLSVGYDWIDLCVTGSPVGSGQPAQQKPDGSYYPKTVSSKMIAGFLKFRVLTF